MTPESAVKKEIFKYLDALDRALDWPIFRMNSGLVKAAGGGYMRLCKAGTADALIFPPKRTVWIEIKAPGAKTAKAQLDAQEAFAVKVRSAGHEYHRVESVDELKAILEEA